MKNPISVAFVLPDNNAGGAQHVMRSFAAALDPEKFRVDLIVICEAGGRGIELPSSVRVTYLSGARLLAALPKLIGKLRELKPDIVVSVMGYLNLAILASLPAHKARAIVREANALSATKAAMPGWLPTDLLYRYLYPRAAAIIAPTSSISRQIQAVVPKATGISVIANPVDEASLRQRANSSIRPPGKGLVVVGAGRLTAQKGFDRLVDLVPLLPADARLFIFGEGGDRDLLLQRVEARGLADRVFFPGYSTDLPAIIAGADVFVLPSRWEGLSNVALESLAVGTPVVASVEASLEEVARAAPAGAITIAPVGPSFAAAIAEIAVDQKRCSAPRPSLLPTSYRQVNAAGEFARLLERVAA